MDRYHVEPILFTYADNAYTVIGEGTISLSFPHRHTTPGVLFNDDWDKSELHKLPKNWVCV